MLFAIRMRDEQEIRARCRQIDSSVDRLRIQTIVIAGDHGDRPAGAPQLLNGELDDIVAWPVRVKQITSDQYQVDVFLNGEVDDRTESLMDDVTIPLCVWISGITIEVEMHIGRV